MPEYALYFGLGGIFQDRLIVEGDAVSAWPLKEIQRTTARDILHGRNSGTWTNASGCTRGVSLDLPEGALGCTFDGTGYVQVLNDGEGYRLPGDTGTRNLSCAGGDIDIVFLVQTSTSNAGCVVQKYDGTNGWYVSITSGAVNFKLGAGGSEIFLVSRGAVSDGDLHLVHCTYDSVAGEIKILIDGVQSGATATCTPTDPVITSANLRIGRFNDGSGGFIGTLAQVVVSRNGNPALSADLQLARAWTDVTAHIRAAEGVELHEGLPSASLRDRMAGTGVLQWTLDNAVNVDEGYYTIGHANQRAGFDLGIPVRFDVDDELYFHGRLMSADPVPGRKLGRSVSCLAADWIETSGRTSVTSVPIGLNMRSDQAFASLVDESAYAPRAVLLHAGSETFPFFGDKLADTIFAGLIGVVESEGGYGYIRRGVLTFESRGVRQLDTVVDATFDETMVGMEVSIGESALINVARGEVTPRSASVGATELLYQQERRQRIGSGETVIIEGPYRDPSQSRSGIGGTDFQTFTAGTDYTLTETEEGGGATYTGNLSVVAEIGGSGFRAEFSNAVGAPAGWLYVQVRGRALYTDAPVLVTERNLDSVRARGERVYDVRYPYLDSTSTARALGQMALGLFAEPVPVPEELQFIVSDGAPAMLAAVLPRAIGDLVALGEPLSAIDTGQRFYIQRASWNFRAGGIVDVTFGVFPAGVTHDAPFGVWDDTEWDESYWAI